MTSYVLMMISGAIIGLITPNFFGDEWYKFWLAFAAVVFAYTAGMLL